MCSHCDRRRRRLTDCLLYEEYLQKYRSSLGKGCSCLLSAAGAGIASVFIVTHDSEALDYADVRLHMNAGVLSGGA